MNDARRGAPRLPPADFADRKLPLCEASGIFYRCAMATQPLLNWDTRRVCRFSGPDLPFPVLYLTCDKLTGFWECFGDDPDFSTFLAERDIGLI